MRYVTLECVECLKEFEFEHNKESCPFCQSGWLRPVYDFQGLSKKAEQLFDGKIQTLWKYFELLPIIDKANIVSMGEGGTPLKYAQYLSKKLGIQLYLKDEASKPPTYTFKDRGATLAISAFKESGIKEVVVYSTGNIGVAFSCYCTEAGIKLNIFCPKSMEIEKRRLIEKTDANLFLVDGTYDDTKKIAMDFSTSNKLFLDKGVKSFYRIASKKTVGYEIFEQLGFKAPNWIFQAVSGGIGPLGLWNAFGELKQMGLLTTPPAMGCIQAKGCAPMYESFLKDSPEISHIKKPTTNILTIATGYPVAYPHLYNVVKKSGGIFEVISDQEAFDMQKILLKNEGICSCPAGATSIAGIAKLAQKGVLKKDETVVGIVTGR